VRLVFRHLFNPQTQGLLQVSFWEADSGAESGVCRMFTTECPWDQCPCEEWNSIAQSGGCDAGLWQPRPTPWRQLELRWSASIVPGCADMGLYSPAPVSHREWASPKGHAWARQFSLAEHALKRLQTTLSAAGQQVTPGRGGGLCSSWLSHGKGTMARHCG